MKDKKLFLRSVHVDEALVQDYMNQAVDVFKLNTVGPQKYVLFYSFYTVIQWYRRDEGLELSDWIFRFMYFKHFSSQSHVVTFSECLNPMHSVVVAGNERREDKNNKT